MRNNQIIQDYFNSKQLKLPLQLEIKIPFDSEVRTFDEVFSKLEVKKHLNNYKDPRGRKSYNEVQMLKLILFCHMEKITSLREMEKAAKNDIRIMWLTGVEDIFYELNNFLIKEEKIDTDRLYIDGTKIESSANKYTFIWKKAVIKFRGKLYKKITTQINSLNKRYAVTDISFPIYEEYEKEYLERIKIYLEKEIKREEIELVYGKGKRKTPLQRDYEKIEEYCLKLIEYEKHLEIMGNTRNSYSKTDIDATFMHMKEDHMRNSQLKPGYNIQIGVSDEYILHFDISSERSDYRTLIPFLESYKKRYTRYPKYPVADAGYGGLVNYRYLKINDMELYQKYSMYSKDTSDKKRMNDPYFTLSLIKDGKDFIATNKERLKFLYKRKIGNDVYQLPNGKNKEINEENLAYQKEVIENLKSPLGI